MKRIIIVLVMIIIVCMFCGCSSQVFNPMPSIDKTNNEYTQTIVPSDIVDPSMGAN